MSDFDYSLDVEGNNDEYEDDNDKQDYDNSTFPPRRNNYMNSQYGEAYGDYRGGYGPGGGFGPPRMRPYPQRGPFPPRGPPPLLGFGPIRPPRRGAMMHDGAKFLFDCDINPLYIKDLPYDLLDLITPDYCGLCALNLDSFSNAKLHYNSKNHYKAQKKFMAQYRPTSNPKEVSNIPMKARNLYCELCDVHITSTSHADSHYSGKSHRSIVEGRKPPKNPILRRPKMKARVEQLIRREKKNPPKAAALTGDQTAKPAENKVVPPELICEICKTSVTCSEQMTNHLNGKRHLTKEKQHILKMMGQAKNKKDNKNIGHEEGGNDEEADMEEDEDEDEDEGEGERPPASAAVEEWGNGGGGDWN